MPWKESCAVDERLKFIADWKRGEMTVVELSRVYGVSRKTAYKWLGRYATSGPTGLAELSRAPHHIPWAVPDELVERIVEIRKAWPTWGARKIIAALKKHDLRGQLPAASTVADILDRRGLVRHRRRRRHAPPLSQPFQECKAPNDVWCADFKGRLVLGDRHICYPFTLSDAYSRFLLRCEGLWRTRESDVQPLFESAFREYGLPVALRTDNGPPFASVSVGGLTRLAIWFIKLGIRPERIEPGRPTQNGRHERIHRTLAEETANPPAPNMAAQRRRLDVFRGGYNYHRPHEALGQRPPAEFFTASLRRFPTRLRQPEYGPEIEVRRVRQHGAIKWRSGELYVSEALRGEPIGIEQTGEEQWTVRYGPLLLGYLDEGNQLKRPRRKPRARRCHP